MEVPEEPTSLFKGRMVTTLCRSLAQARVSGTPFVVSEHVLITEDMLVHVGDRLRVLGQVARPRLVEQLRMGGAMPQKLVDTLGLTQQNVSKHLQVLHRSGTVRRPPDG